MLMRYVTFFVDELLWMMTWGWYQLTLGLIFTWFIFILMGRMRLMPALVLTLSSYGFAVLTYFLCVSYLLINFFQWKFIGGELPNVYNPPAASVLLGIILAVLQGLFYCLLNYFRPFPVIHFFTLSLMSNILAAVCATFFIRLSF